MSVILDKISVAKPVIVEKANMPLDARCRCNNEADFPNIETPFIGMLIYTIDDGKFWVVTKLKSKLIGSMAVANMAIDEYHEFVGGGGGGAIYEQGDGILISEENVISVDFETVAKKGDIVKYTSGTGIKIENNVITCTLEIKEYSAGDGLQLVGSAFEVDWLKVAKKSDIKSYSGSDNIAIGSDGKIDVTSKVALKSDIKSYSGSDNISVSSAGVIDVTGQVALKTDITEQNFDYNALENKPKFIAGDGIKIEIELAESLIVSGAGNTESNGTYELVDHKKKGTARVWQKANRKFYHDGTKWVIDSDTDGASFYYSATGEADPWTLTFVAALSEFGNAPSVTRATSNSSDRIVISADFSEVIGDINSILDEINGEEV